MTREFLNKLCCPFDKSDLTIQVYKENENKEILEGLIECPECNRYFPVVHGVPIMTPDEYREKQLEAPLLQKWGLQLDEKKKRMQLKNSND